MDDETGYPVWGNLQLAVEVYGCPSSEPRSFEELRVAAASSVRGGFLGTKTLRNGYLPRSSGASTCFELIYAMVVASDYEDVFHVYTMYIQCIAFSTGQVIRLVCLVIYAIWYLFSIQQMARCFQFDFHNISYFGMDGSTTDHSLKFRCEMNKNSIFHYTVPAKVAPETAPVSPGCAAHVKVTSSEGLGWCSITVGKPW